MLTMKHNKEFQIKIQAGTNVEMSKGEFLQEIIDGLGAAELLINSSSKIRVHIELIDEDLKLVKKWTPEKTDELVQKILNLGE